MENSKGSNVVQYVLIGLLVISAFFIGSLWTQVNNPGSKQGSAIPSVANTTGSNGTAEVAKVDTVAMATELGIKAEDYSACLTSKEAADRVNADVDTGEAAGVTGTPAAYLIDTSTGKGKEIGGAVPYADLKAIADGVINGSDVEDMKDVKAVDSTDYVRGNNNAKYALIEYSDYDCPFCKRFHPTVTRLIDEYKDQVKWIYRQMPLDSLHPNARSKSIAAICAGKLAGSDAFWKFTDSFLTE